MITIRVPCSSANIGPGFDVIGLALSIHLTLRITYPTPPPSPLPPQNCTIVYSPPNPTLPLVPTTNLITRTALYVLRVHSQHTFPSPIHIAITNPIPLARGLGSSGAAVVAGVLLANEVGGLHLSKARMLDYCLMVERHPDNVAAALYGGFVGTYLNDVDPLALARAEIPLAEEQPEPSGGLDTGLSPPAPPEGIGRFVRFGWADEVKAVVVIPDFGVATHDAREVLPETYSRKDIVRAKPPLSPPPVSPQVLNPQQIHNLSRCSILPHLLTSSPVDPRSIHNAMSDRLHQPYRAALIPGLTRVTSTITPATHPGLCGICLSGAGPTILALAVDGFEAIAESVMAVLREEVRRAWGKEVRCEWRVLEVERGGAAVSRDEDE
ncbi:MAG: hypothetical protein M1833_001464 [Piccolia ochrophora]|nr:MAG: hypothetical protein M1833_001464 [Piccolia ochrophora]